MTRRRLLDLKAQEDYYQNIVSRYLKYCSDAESSNELLRRFAAVSLGDPSISTYASEPKSTVSKPTKPQSTTDAQRSGELSTILMAMRKLREATVATHRSDLWAQRVYIFLIRAALLVRNWEAYHPALLYLLNTIHPSSPLSGSELAEFVSYRVLDLACRQIDLAGAFEVRWAYRLKERRVDRALHALVHDDWWLFWRIHKAVNAQMRCVLDWAVPRMRRHALHCLARTYFTAEKKFVEAAADLEWDELVQSEAVGWELEGDVVTIRRKKGK